MVSVSTAMIRPRGLTEVKTISPISGCGIKGRVAYHSCRRPRPGSAGDNPPPTPLAASVFVTRKSAVSPAVTSLRLS